MSNLFERFLTKKELETVKAEYEKLKETPNLSTVERTKPISDAYMLVMHRFNTMTSKLNNEISKN